MKTLIVLLICLTFWSMLAAETIISDITASETWTLAGSPYIVNGGRLIYNGATVTIDAGVQVRFGSGATLTLGNFSAGNIAANGTQNSPVVFTANTLTPTPGYWSNIRSPGWGGNTVFNHCVFEYGGSSYGEILVEGGSPQFSNCVFRHSQNSGIYFQAGPANGSLVSGCTFTNNPYPVYVNANNMDNLGSGNQYLGNTDNRIQCSGGSINASSTWTAQTTPIRVLASISGSSGSAPTIVIPLGAILEFAAGTSIALGSGDVLRATGVTFRGEQATPGFWYGVYFYSNGGNNLLSGCTIRDAGSSGNPAVQVYCPNSIITGCTITNCSNMGIWLELTSVSAISGCTVTGCGSYPLSLSDNSVRVLGEGNNFSGNTLDMVEVRIWSIQTSGVWRNPGVPYYLTGNLSISYVSPYPHIKILPGTVVMLPNSASIYIGSYNSNYSGSLEAEGVTFTRSVPGAVPKGLYFYPNTVSSQCQFTNCTFEYLSGDSQGAIYVEGVGPTFTNCTFRNNPASAIVGGNYGRFTVLGSSFNNNGSYPVQISPRGFDAYLGSGCTYTGNNPNRILVTGAVLDEGKTYVWNDPGVPLEISSTLTVYGYSPSVPILKLNSGLVLLFRSGVTLNIGYVYGSYPGGIQAEGATFSALSGTTGGWNGLYLDYSVTANSYLRNCIIEYAGTNGNIFVPFSTMPVIESCVIRYGFCGLRIQGNYGVTNVIRNYILNNQTGVLCENNANPVIGGSLADANSITGNTVYGVQNATPSITVNAEYNWWGHSSGPTHAANPGGSGDAVSNYVDYDPWRTAGIGDAPARFHLLTPATASVLETLTPLLDWEEAIDPTPGDTVFYTLELALNTSFTSGLITVSLLSATFYNVPTSVLDDDTRYYWRMKATDTQSQTTTSYENYFYFDTAVPEAPLPFNPLSPVYNGTVLFTSNLLTWQAAIDPDAGDILTYTVYRDISAGFESAEIITTSATSAYTGFCAPGTLYYWKVEATDLTDRSTFSPTWRFFVHPDARPRPPVVLTLNPQGNDMLLSWDSVPGADSYDVYYVDVPTDTYIFLQNVGTTQYLHPNAELEHSGFYKVVAHDTY